MMVVEEKSRIFMCSRLTEKIFHAMWEVKAENRQAVAERYKVTEQQLYNALWQEFNIEGMEVRIANTAFDFLIDRCKDGKDLKESLHQTVRDMILAATIFYSNIVPNAVSTSEAYPPA